MRIFESHQAEVTYPLRNRCENGTSSIAANWVVQSLDVPNYPREVSEKTLCYNRGSQRMAGSATPATVRGKLWAYKRPGWILIKNIAVVKAGEC